MSKINICISGINCCYNKPLLYGHDNAADFIIDNPTKINLNLIPTNNLLVNSSNYSTVYSVDNIIVKKDFCSNDLCVVLNDELLACYSPNNGICYIKKSLMDKNEEYSIKLPLEDFLWTDILYRNNRWILHGGASIKNKRTYVYFGESGAGKSTISRLFQNNGFKILSDERLIISSIDFSINSAYWVSSNGSITNKEISANNIIYLRHSTNQNNHLIGISCEEMYSYLSTQVFYPLWDKDLLCKTIIMIKKFIKNKQCYIYEFKPDESAIEYLEENIKQKGDKNGKQ